MTDFGDVASAVANNGEARKTEDRMSQFLASGLPMTVGRLGKGPRYGTVEFDGTVSWWRNVRMMR